MVVELSNLSIETTGNYEEVAEGLVSALGMRIE